MNSLSNLSEEEVQNILNEIYELGYYTCLDKFSELTRRIELLERTKHTEKYLTTKNLNHIITRFSNKDFGTL